MVDLSERYAGKPMLRLLDSYVLDAIGALDDRTGAELTANAPRLSQALGASGETWQQVVENAMGMPSDSADAVRAIWAQYVDDALADAGTPDPLDFTYRLNDSRFSGRASD